MAVVVTESVKSRSITNGANPAAELVYDIRDATGEADAEAGLIAAAPTTFNDLVVVDTKLKPVDGISMWVGTVVYGRVKDAPKEEGDSTFTFETGGGTEHITQGIALIDSESDSTVPDVGATIGVTKDGIDGVDIVVARYEFTETHYIADADVDLTFKQTLNAVTGTVNDSSFKGLAAGECLFLGASGTYDAETELWAITYRFSGSENKTGIAINGITATIDKKGWEVVWVYYEEVEDSSAHVIVQTPLAAFVVQVYEEGDFSALGIGV